MKLNINKLFNFLYLPNTSTIDLAFSIQEIILYCLNQTGLGAPGKNPYPKSITILKRVIPFFPAKIIMHDLSGEMVSSSSLWAIDPISDLLNHDIKISFQEKNLNPFHRFLSKNVEKAIQGEIIKNNCIDWTAPNGLSRYFKIDMCPWMVSKMAPGGILTVIEDLTDLRRQETYVRDLECFAYMCPHDLKASVRILNSFLTLLNQYRDGKKDEIEIEYFGFLFDALRSCNEIIKNSLESLAPNVPNLEVETINLNAVVTEVINSLQPLINEKNASIWIGDLPHVKADFVLMKRIVLNLITNSLKFSENPRIKIFGSADQDHIVFCVQDNGIGIPIEMHKKIFETYSKSQASDTSSSGLGLSYCRKVLSMWGAQIGVDSTPGNGATFTLKFRK